MSSSNEAPLSPRSQLALSCFEELLDCTVADVASECHRITRLGLDRIVDAEEEELRDWATRDHYPGAAGGAAAKESGGGKGGVDVFGQTHPAIAADVVECMNCSRFVLHLEKCMGKGRRARTRTTRSSIAGRTRSNNGSAASSYSPYPNTANTNRGSTPKGNHNVQQK